MQTAVTACLTSKQLLLFIFAEEIRPYCIMNKSIKNNTQLPTTGTIHKKQIGVFSLPKCELFEKVNGIESYFET